jgi:hypothetical protein
LILPTIPPPGNVRVMMVIVYALLIVAPVIYVVVASFLEVDAAPAGDNLFVYLLFAIGLLTPTVVPLLDRSYISSWKKDGTPTMETMQLLVMLVIIRTSIVEAIYIYGLVAFLVTGEMLNMLYFYVIAICWTFVYWPTESRQQSLLERMERA